MTRVEVQIQSELGLHLRAAARFVETASRWPCRVRVATTGPLVDGKSLLALSSLLARQGATLSIECEGSGEEEAAAALTLLVRKGFPSAEPR